jgi:hypothetical protein
MGLEQYRLDNVASAFERYYHVFLQNSLVGRKYTITLSSGEKTIGVPTTGSLVDPRNLENTEFILRSDGGKIYRIPFRDLKEAEAE